MRPASDADDDRQREDDLRLEVADLARVVKRAAPLDQLLSEVAQAAASSRCVAAARRLRGGSRQRLLAQSQCVRRAPTRVCSTLRGPCVSAVHNAQLLAGAQIRAAQLQQALGSRSVIDQAIGIIRSRSGGSADKAFDRLRDLSQHANVKLSLVAERLVDEAVRAARA